MHIALITARGGSKGLPRKNILPLCGKPLIQWTIEAAQQCGLFEHVYVSSEDAEIITFSIQAGAEIIHRPTYLARDEIGSEPVIAHAIDTLRSQQIEPVTITLLQPTSPLRNAQHIQAAMALYHTHNAQCVISMFAPPWCIAKAYQQHADGSVSGAFSPTAPYQRRQDLPTILLPNGAIYIISCSAFSQAKSLPRKHVFPYIMTYDDSYDIDTLDDFQLIQHKLEEQLT